MTVTIVGTPTLARAITGGVDTHADVHVAAALDPIGGLLGVQEFPATSAGYARLLGWLGGFGTVCLVGIAATGRTGAAGASPIRWMPSAPPGPPSPAGRPACRKAATGRWRRSGR